MEFALTVALSMAKSMPDEISAKEYLQHLRAHIKHDPASGNRYIDMGAFWQAQYLRMKPQLSVAENLNFTLSQQLEALKTRPSSSESTGASPSNSSRKRKRGDDKASQSKRLRGSPDRSTAGSLSPGLDYDILSSNQPGTRAMRNLYKLQSMMKGGMYTVDPVNMASVIIDTAKALSIIVEQLPIQSQQTTSFDQKSRESDLATTMIVISRAFVTLLHALRKLCDLTRSGHLIGNTIYHCVNTFDSIFTTMEAAATGEAKILISSELAHMPAKNLNRGRHKETPLTKSHLLLGLTNLTRSLIDVLDTKIACHSQLLEGLLYILLTTLGEVEHRIAFYGPRNDDIVEEVRNLPPSDETLLDPAHKLERRAMIIEAPYMLSILRKAIAAAPAAFKKHPLPNKVAGKDALTPIALKRLQVTLVSCIFGPDPHRRIEDSHLLKRPVLDESVLIPEQAIVRSGDKEETAEEWFEAELWATVGWEILGTDGNL